MQVHTPLALAFVNATAKELRRAEKVQVRPSWVALRVADRVDRNEDAGTCTISALSVRVSRKTREKIKREQRVEV